MEIELEEPRSPWPHRGFTVRRLGADQGWASRITDSDNVDRGTYPTHAHAFRAIDAHLDDAKPFVNDAQ